MTRHIVATVDELPPGGRKRVTVRGRDIAVFRIDDTYHAIQDRCPHEGASLCAGRIVGLAVSDRPGSYSLTRKGELLRCPWHGWEFDIRTGQSWTDPERIRVRSFQTSVQTGAELVTGPYVADTFAVTVERDYVLIDTGPPGWIDAVVTQRIEVAEGVVALELARANGEKLPPFYKTEVKVGGSLAWRANNPGNLRAASTKIGSVRGKSGSFAVFATLDDGRSAQKALYLKAYGSMTVRDAIEKLTPPSENNTKKYLAQLKAAGVDLDKDVKSQIDGMMKGVQANEGMIKGIVIPRTK